MKAEKDVLGLINLSNDVNQDQKKRERAIESIGEIVAPASFIIQEVEQGKESYQNIVDALWEVRYDEVIDHLASLLSNDRDYVIRMEAAQALGKICSKRVVTPLVDALDSIDGGIRLSAAISLKDLFYKCRKVSNKNAEGRLITLLEEERDDSIRKAAAGALGYLRSERVIPPLIQVLGDHDLNWDRYDQIWIYDDRRSALVMIGDPAVKPLIQTMKSEDEDINVRRGATWVLGEIRNPTAIESLDEIAKSSKDSRLRLYAENAIRTIKQQRES
jgi:HEAT repeat protein